MCRMVMVPSRNTPRRSAGFTLVELMIVVAIIGILATIAIPNYQSFQARARGSEVKLNLKALADATVAYYLATGTNTTSLRAVGWEPVGSPRYIYGWSLPSGSPGPYNSATYQAAYGGFSADLMVNNAGAPLTGANLPLSLIFNPGGAWPFNFAEPGLYLIGAVGNIDTDDTLDTWTYCNVQATCIAQTGENGPFVQRINDVDN